MPDNISSVEQRREAKRAARRTYRSIRNGIPAHNKREFDACITQALLDSMSYRYSEKILAYASFADEVDTLAFCRTVLACGRELYLPKSYPGGKMRFFAIQAFEQLQTGAFGILEPTGRSQEYVPSCQKPDLCLVPGVCFDVYGYRIGYGKGYYDRFLAGFSGVSMGLAYEACFCREALPYEKRYDKTVDFIVTEKGINKRVCP